MSALEVGRRAFSETSDPSAYVSRPATNAVLDGLHAWATSNEAGSTAAVLIGTPGLGKTMMLRVAEYGLNPQSEDIAVDPAPAPPVRALYLPYASLGLVDLCHWVHGLLGRRVPEAKDARDEEWAVASLVALGHSGDDPFFLLFDDADSMHKDVIRALIGALPTEHSPLRLLLAVNPDSKGSRLIAALHALAPREFVLRDRMTLEETGEYLRRRLRWAGVAQSEYDRIDAAEINRIHSLSSGVPRALHLLALRIIEDADSDAHADVGAKRRREDWLGQPIADEL